MKFHTKMAQFILAGTIVIGSGKALADGDALKGEQVFKKCIACHSVKEAKNKVGPHLIGIVGRPIASVPDFKYSDDMKAYAIAAMSWNVEKLNAYLESPKAVVAKTKMAFPGLKKEDERADLIAYLKTIP
jgi:cytochrome c